MRFATYFSVALFVLCVSSFARADDMGVVAVGVGRTVQTATAQARTNALRAALGAVLPLEMLVKQEATIRALLERPDDFVIEATELGTPSAVDDGLACVILRVRLNTAALQSALQQQGLAVARLDGLSLMAAHETRQESRADAGQIIAEFLRPLPAGLLQATAEVKTARHKFDGKTMRIELPVSVTLDSAAYATALEGLRATLKKLGVTSRVVNLPGAGEQPLALLWKEAGLPDALKQKDGPSLLAVCELLADKSSRWSLSVVPAPVVAAFGRDSTVTVKVELIDAAGIAVTSRDFNLGGSADKKTLANIFAYAPFYRTAAVGPSINSLQLVSGNISGQQRNPATQEHILTFNLGMEELRQISNVRCTVVNAAQISQ